MQRFNKAVALLLCMVMLIGFVPVSALAADAAGNPTIVIAGSDYQASNSGATMKSIISQMGYDSIDGVLMGGDYNGGSKIYSSAAEVKAVDTALTKAGVSTSADRIYVQGNHDTDLSPSDSGNLLSTEGEHDTDYYGVYVINQEDFPWQNSSSTLVGNTASALGEYLDAKVSANYSKPIFVVTHLPLHVTSRGDNKYARLIFNELEAAGEAGLNIIFLFGHNHSGGYDAYLGNGSIYLPKGSSLTVVDGSSSTYTDSSISFTYMNYGYLGNIAGSSCTHQTMTAFEITDSQVTVKRYAEDGAHQLKAKGATVSGYNTDSSIIGTEGAVIKLGAPEEKVTVENTDKTVYVTAAGLTGLTVTKTKDTASNTNEAYSAFASYNIDPVGYTQGKTATVTITLDAVDGFDASRKVVVIDEEKGTETETSIVDGKVIFTTNHFSTYSIAQRAVGSGYTYELVTSIEAGEKYVIVGNDNPVALMDNSGEMGSQSVTISGTTLTSDVALTEWTISGTDNGTIISDAGNQLGYNNSAWGLVTGGTVEFDITANSGNFKMQMQRGYKNYNFYYDGTDWTDKSTSDHYVRLYKLTGSGSGGGSTVTPEGGDWVTISSGVGGTIYTLDEDGLNVGSDEKYLIVDTSANGTGNVLTNSNGDAANTQLTITDKVIVVEDDTNVAWTPTGSSSSADFQNGSYHIYLSYNNGVLYTSTRSLTVVHNGNGEYTLKRNSSSSGYYVQYGSSDGWETLSTSENSVYLFRKTGTESAGDAEYAKLDGELTYTVSRGTSAEEALAAVKEGINVVVSSDQSAETILDDGDENITWTMSGYDGTVAGEYAVTISYKGVKLGTAKVIVPEVTITGYDCQTSGSVKVGATGNVRTGANITVKLEDGTSYTVPVTMSMLSKDGEKITATEGGEITGLTVTYNGVVVCENFTLTVREPSSYPEYPDEGAVKVKKTGAGVQFQSTGVAQVEISASGIPMNQGVDVLLILDTSSSMGMNGSLTDGRTRIDVLKECVNALIANLQDERADGSVPDVSIAVVHFNGYTGNKNTNYIGSTARNTSTLGGVLTDDGNGGAWVDVQNMGANWAANIPDDCSGTNYDHGLLLAYDLLSARQEAESSRKQFALFMSDGAPFQYNGVNSNSLSADWENWILGSYTQAEVEALTHVSNPEFYYGSNNGNGQKHRVAEAIKGTGLFEIVTYSDTSSSGTTKLETVPGLGVTMYSVGLALEATNMPTDVAGQEAILKTIASSEDVFYSVTSAAGLQEAFDDFAGEVLMAATNARFVDQMGDAYDLQMGTIRDLNGDAIGVENKIEILSYDIWTRSDYLAGKCTADKIGDRKGTSTVLETITFNDDGTEAYSSKVSTGPNGETIAAGSNILIGGVIYAQSFWYNSNHTAAEITGVDIPTGMDSTTNRTTGSTNMLPAETFYWKVGTIKTTELAMRYYVYLTGSMEGTREAGSYPTNNYANLYYNNYLNQPIGQPCVKGTVSPVLAWDAANVSYAFYLVDEKGNIIVNQTTGETGSFANKVAVTNPVVYREVLLNNTGNVESIEVASLGVLPDGYELYDKDAVYTIQIKSDATGSWTIAKGDDKVASTYVTQYDPGNAAAYSSELTKNADADFTHTVVWFAVLWKVQALPDTVVIDYGLPVDISVLANDMFGENGKLAGVGEYSDSLNLNGHDDAMASGFGTSYTGTYGAAKADTTTGKVRYTPANMQMDSYEKFAYAVNYTGNENAGCYYDTVTVIPATTIYYEDSFVDTKGYVWQNGGWVESDAPWTSEGERIDGTQAEDRPGQYSLNDANNIYGYDDVYAEMSTFSMGSAKKLHVNYDQYGTFQFTFYGTGFDLISMTSARTGGITMDVYVGTNTSADGTLATYTGADGEEHTCQFAVDAYYGYKYENDEWVVTTPDDSNAIYQVPVMEVADLTYGQYTAVVKAQYAPLFDHGQYGDNDANTGKGAYDFYLDAIRIYDPAYDGASDGTDDTTIEDAYKADGEGWPSYIELRNSLIEAESFTFSTTQEGAVFIDGKDEAAIADYKNYGPNNEVYLAKGQSIAFRLSCPDTVKNIHIGVSAVGNGDVTYEIKNVDGNAQEYSKKVVELKSATDMYYDLTSWKGDIIVITNTGDGILSLTNIKSTYTEKPGAVVSTETPESGEAAEQTVKQLSRMTTFGLNAASVDEMAEAVPAETTAPETQEIKLTSIYMTAEAAELVVAALNAPAQEETPEPTIPEESEPEETEPEVTEPEATEPENFQPKLFVVSVSKNSVKVGQKVDVTVTTSSEVDYVTVNGEVISRPSSDKKGVRTWKLSVTAARKGVMELNVICFNTADEASEPVTRQIMVRSKNSWEEIYDLIFDIFH